MGYLDVYYIRQIQIVNNLMKTVTNKENRLISALGFTGMMLFFFFFFFLFFNRCLTSQSTDMFMSGRYLHFMGLLPKMRMS